MDPKLIPSTFRRPERQSLGGVAAFASICSVLLIAVGSIWLWVHLIETTESRGWQALIVIAGLLIGLTCWTWVLYLFFPLFDFYRKAFEAMRGGPPWYRHPSDIDRYPDYWKAGAYEIHNQIADAINREMDLLAKLHIQLPTLLSEPSFVLTASKERLKVGNYAPEKLEIVFPSYAIPHHFFYHLVESNKSTGRRASGFLVVPTNPGIQAAERLFTNYPSKAIQQYSGAWLTRNPYAPFKAMNGVKTVANSLKGVSEQTARTMSDARGVDSLGRARELSPDEFDDILWRLEFFGTLVVGTGLPFTGKPPVPSWVSDSVPFELPVPSLALSPQLATLKLIPGPSASISACNRLWGSLRSLKNGFGFDLVADRSGIHFRLTFANGEKEFVESQIQIHLPDFAARPCDVSPNLASPYFVADFFPTFPYLHVKSFRQGSPDPYASLLKLLDNVPIEDQFCLRVLAFPLRDETFQMMSQELERLASKPVLLDLQKLWGWQSPYARDARLTNEAEALRKNLKDRVDDLRKKLPAWVASASLYSSKKELLAEIHRHWLAQYETPEQKMELSPPKKAVQLSGTLGKWTIWNSEELAAVAHFPDSEVACERLERTTGKMKAPPPIMTGEGSAIGVNECRGQKTTVVIPEQVRDRHLYIIGKTRTGKSTLMLNLAVQDIRAGKGIGVVDPHGDLIEDLLAYIPKERVQDTVYWDASERARPIGLNVMEVHTDEEVGMVADDLVVTFRRLSESWGDRMENLLRYVFHTLLNCEDTTFFDVQHILANPTRREELIVQLEDPMLIDFWQQQFPKLKDAVQPILGRMGKFVLTPALSATLGRRESTLNFFDVLQNRRVLLINLAQGKVGEDSARLLGSLVVSQIQLAAMRRAKMRREAREPFNLYVDEFQNFTTSAFDKILSEAGKYKLCLTLAHQYVSQLEDRIRNAILGNAGTMLMFPSSAQDASCLRSELGSYTVEDLTDLAAQEHEALCRPPTRSSDTFKLRTFPPPERPQTHFARDVVEHSRANYGKPIQTQLSRTAKAPKPCDASVTKTSASTPRTEHVAVTMEALNLNSKVEHGVARSDEAKAGARVQPVASILPIESLPGRGGMQHKKLQHDIRLAAEKYGYLVTLEKPILGGAGCVDVALEKGAIGIACQVCITTGAEHEVKNIKKCLEAGFSAVVLISASRKTLNHASELLANAVPPEAENRVRLLPLEGLHAFLAELEALGQNRTETIRGRTVRTSYTTLSPEQEKIQREAIYQVISESMRRMGRLED